MAALVPEAFQLIDFWHAAQHLGAAAEHIFPQDSTARSTWFKRYRKILRDDPDGAEKVIRSLRYYWTASGRLDAGLESELNYFRNHRNRMNYAKHQAMNVPIGSGVTESACKKLVPGYSEWNTFEGLSADDSDHPPAASVFWPDIPVRWLGCEAQPEPALRR